MLTAVASWSSFEALPTRKRNAVSLLLCFLSQMRALLFLQPLSKIYYQLNIDLCDFKSHTKETLCGKTSHADMLLKIYGNTVGSHYPQNQYPLIYLSTV